MGAEGKNIFSRVFKGCGVTVGMLSLCLVLFLPAAV
jgi:hypothetical protein